MCNAQIEPTMPEIRPISRIWYTLLKEYHVPMNGTIVEVAPGYETKIGAALALLEFQGRVILIEPDLAAAVHIQRAYQHIMPRATVEVVAKPLHEVCVGTDIPRYADALIANHPFDDMVIACAMGKGQPSFFSQEREDGACSVSPIKELYDAIGDKDYIRGILATIAAWKNIIQELKPACVIASQYPGHKLMVKGLTKRQNSGSIIIEALRDFYERYLNDQYKEKSFGNQGNPLWWMIAREPYAELAHDLAAPPCAITRLGEAIFVPQQARRLDSDDYDVVYVDHTYFARSDYGTDVSREIHDFAIVLDNDNPASPQTITVYADRQKDVTEISLGGNIGSGRAVYYGTQYNVVGIGKTSLCTSSIPSHSTGKMDLIGALRRVVLSKWINYFTQRSVVHLVVIARKETAQFKWNPNPVPLALLVRVDEGALDRPSHVEYSPDIAIDFENTLTQYAQLDAEYFAYRLMLGAWSTGNYSLNGRMIDLETVSFVKYRGPYTTASSKYRENIFGYEGLGFIRILRQLADVKGIKNIDIEKRFVEERREHLARCFLSLLGVDKAKLPTCFSRHHDEIVVLSDQFERLAKKISPRKTDLNLYKPVPEHEDPSLLDMSNLFRNLAEIYACPDDREKKAFGSLTRKRALGSVRPGVIYEPQRLPNAETNQSQLFIKEQAVITHDKLEGFLSETRNFVHVLFRFLDTLDSEKCIPEKPYWEDRLKTVNQDFLTLNELNGKLAYWVEEYRSGGIDPETLGVEIEKLVSLPHYPTGRNFYLENVPLLNYVNATRRELETLSPHVNTIDVREGEAIICAGEHADSLFILMQGSCKMIVDGQESSTIRNRGALIGEAAIIAEQGIMVADVVAQTPVRVLRIHRNDLEAIMGAHLESKRLLTNIIAQKKDGAADRILDLAIFKGIDPEDMRLFLADKAVEKKFSQDEQLIRQGEYSMGVYLLVHGSVVLSQSKTGLEIEPIELKDMPLTQGIFGERSILFDQEAICTVRADEDVTTLFIPKDDFRELFDLYPQFLPNCLDHISNYSHSNEDRIALVSELQKKLLNPAPNLL